MNFFKTALASMLLAAGCASATTIDFEQANGTPGGVAGGVAINTQGFTFTDATSIIDIAAGSVYSGNGPAHSGSYAALAEMGPVITMTATNAGVFSLQGLWIHGFEGYGTAGSLTGYLNGIATGSVLFSITDSWQNVAANFAQVDRIIINADDAYMVDDIDATITASDVPEPASIALFGLGLAGLAYAMRRKPAFIKR
jgi:hypothetical protein